MHRIQLHHPCDCLRVVVTASQAPFPGCPAPSSALWNHRLAPGFRLSASIKLRKLAGPPPTIPPVPCKQRAQPEIICAHPVRVHSLLTSKARQDIQPPAVCAGKWHSPEEQQRNEGCQREQVILDGEGLSARTCVQQCQALMCLGGEAAEMDVRVLLRELSPEERGCSCICHWKTAWP